MQCTHTSEKCDGYDVLRAKPMVVQNLCMLKEATPPPAQFVTQNNRGSAVVIVDSGTRRVNLQQGVPPETDWPSGNLGLFPVGRCISLCMGCMAHKGPLLYNVYERERERKQQYQ